MFGKKKRQVPVIILTGYLGAGKTTLLNELLKQETRKVALIVNDMGSINIDAGLLKGNRAEQMDARMIELQNGCICCTLRDEFMYQIEELSQDPAIEAVLVEASGISDPSSIAQGFLAFEETHPRCNAYLSSIITVADADRIYREFLNNLQEQADQEQNEEDPDIINLIMDQIEFCDTIILNKCDLLEESQLDEVAATLRKLQNEAEIIRTSHSRVDIDRIVRNRPFDFEKIMNSSAVQKALLEQDQKNTGTLCVEEYGISSFVYEERKPFNRERFGEFLENYPEEMIRGKGYLWFSDDDMHVQLFEQAGRNASISELSNWVAAFTEEDRQEVFENYPETLESWDPLYGDRLNQIVFIGKGYDRDRIVSELQACHDLYEPGTQP